MILGEIQINNDKDIIKVREIVKNLSKEFGFNRLDKIRIGTAASELTRNLYEHASGGNIVFEVLKTSNVCGFKLTFRDSGPGIKDLDKILNGSYNSEVGLGIGIRGAKTLMDDFYIKTGSSGTIVEITKFVKNSYNSINLETMQNKINAISEETALNSLKEKNREILLLLEELKKKNDQLNTVNVELNSKNLQLNDAMKELENSNYEIMQTMTALDQANKKLEAIIETVPDAILVTDDKGLILAANITFKKLFKQFIGEDLEKKVNFNDYKSDNIFQTKIAECIKNLEDINLIIKPERQKWLRLISTKAYFTEIDLPFAFVFELSDITSFIEFEELRKQFVSTVSHELRTPITSINLGISNYKKYQDKLSIEKREKILDIIEQSSEVLIEIVDDLLILSKMDSQKIELNFEKIDLTSLINSILIELKPKIDEKKIKTKNELNNNFIIVGDPVRIKQIFRILVDNAVKYTAEYTKIIIKGDYDYKGKYNQKNQEGVLIKVIDHGIGIKPHDLKKLFTRFFRSEEVSDIKGTGLGLAIAKEIIELHNGAIFVESEFGKGSEFIVFFPFL